MWSSARSGASWPERASSRTRVSKASLGDLCAPLRSTWHRADPGQRGSAGGRRHPDDAQHAYRQTHFDRVEAATPFGRLVAPDGRRQPRRLLVLPAEHGRDRAVHRRRSWVQRWPLTLTCASARPTVTTCVSVGEGGFVACLAGTTAIVVDSALRGMVTTGSQADLEVRAVEDTKTLAGVERLVLRCWRQGSVGVTMSSRSAVASSRTSPLSPRDIYMRGIDWTYVPTTLMAMADSCIGGKSSINVGGVKNLVGGFHPPDRVVVDPVFLRASPPLRSQPVWPRLPRSASAAGAGVRGLSRDVRQVPPRSCRPAAARAGRQAVVHRGRRARQEGASAAQLRAHVRPRVWNPPSSHSISHGAAVPSGSCCALTHPLAPDSSRDPRTGQALSPAAAQTSRTSATLCSVSIAAQLESAFRSDKKHSAATSASSCARRHGGVAEVEVDDGGSAWDTISPRRSACSAPWTGEADEVQPAGDALAARRSATRTASSSPEATHAPARRRPFHDDVRPGRARGRRRYRRRVLQRGRGRPAAVPSVRPGDRRAGADQHPHRHGGCLSREPRAARPRRARSSPPTLPGRCGSEASRRSTAWRSPARCPWPSSGSRSRRPGRARRASSGAAAPAGPDRCSSSSASTPRARPWTLTSLETGAAMAPLTRVFRLAGATLLARSTI